MRDSVGSDSGDAWYIDCQPDNDRDHHTVAQGSGEPFGNQRSSRTQPRSARQTVQPPEALQDVDWQAAADALSSNSDSDGDSGRGGCNASPTHSPTPCLPASAPVPVPPLAPLLPLTIAPLPAPAPAPDFECGIFWDYENISLPRAMDGAEASNRLREVCLRACGRLVERRVYHDPEKVNSVQPHNRSALDMAGFTLVDCPARNLKETIDKKIIVDVMHFALTRVARQQPACVVLLTNDGDYAYMLSRLRDLQVRAVVIYEEGHAAQALLTACDCSFTWRTDVLRHIASDVDGGSRHHHTNGAIYGSRHHTNAASAPTLARAARRATAGAATRVTNATRFSKSKQLRQGVRKSAKLGKRGAWLPSAMVPKKATRSHAADGDTSGWARRAGITSSQKGRAPDWATTTSADALPKVQSKRRLWSDSASDGPNDWAPDGPNDWPPDEEDWWPMWTAPKAGGKLKNGKAKKTMGKAPKMNKLRLGPRGKTVKPKGKASKGVSKNKRGKAGKKKQR